ncbi:DNA topology modulation protein FlaR [Halobacillus salinarum]|uniref:DNA topology modulation protein FlaR n=1 Tax=Halobacillus salinarum TaxID=2932257 RepID=A0ABY4EL10_9BACI|nr:AAA family ATPase [Halobacillus salinarum]UOQ45157.1 DNA topology modulation protein FlaR [Halobacillus salinarum]
MKPNRIFITGSIGSGKTTLARYLSNQLFLPLYELDDFVWEHSNFEESLNSVKDRNQKFLYTIHTNQWVIEGKAEDWIGSGFAKADEIVLLLPSKSTRNYRIIKRFLKQFIQFERSSYLLTLHDLKHQLITSSSFEEKTFPFLQKSLKTHSEKTISIRTQKQLEEYIVHRQG